MLEEEILIVIKSDPYFEKYERLYERTVKKNSESKDKEVGKIIFNALNSAIDFKYKPDFNNNN